MKMARAQPHTRKNQVVRTHNLVSAFQKVKNPLLLAKIVWAPCDIRIQSGGGGETASTFLLHLLCQSSLGVENIYLTVHRNP